MFVSEYVEINLGNDFIFKSNHLRLNVKRQQQSPFTMSNSETSVNASKTCHKIVDFTECDRIEK